MTGMWTIVADHAHVLRAKCEAGVVVIHENGVFWVRDGTRVDEDTLDGWVVDDEWVTI